MTFFFWRSTSLRATLQRPLPVEMVISKSKTSRGPRHDCQRAMWPSETHEFGAPGVDNAWFNRKVTAFDGCFNLHFVPHRNIAQPWQINWAFLRT